MTKASAAFAVTALIGISFIGIGTAALVAPEQAAKMFGVPIGVSETPAYLWTTGLRDIVLGIWLLALIALGVSLRVLGASLLVLALIAAGDIIVVLVSVGTQNLPALGLHGLAIVVFLGLGGWWFRRGV